MSNTSIEERLQRLESAFGAEDDMVRSLRESFAIICELEGGPCRPQHGPEDDAPPSRPPQ